MRYPHIRKASFLVRRNRFVAEAVLDGEPVLCHVKNTGRCRELLVPGAVVYLNDAWSEGRKTRYDLVAVEKQGRLINMDSQAPNRVFQEYLEKGRFLPRLTRIQPEFRFGDSRFDFCLEQGEKRHLIEVKGVTLEENNIARFPDAPTERGVKHLKGLISAKKQGYTCWACFVVQMSGVRYMVPNDVTHPAFGAALRTALAEGVSVLALECHVTPASLEITHEIPVDLS